MMPPELQQLLTWLHGIYQIDINVSYEKLGSLFHPCPGTAVGALTEEIRRTYGSAAASLSTNGTTASNQVMLLTAMGHDPQPAVVFNRNAHVSLHNTVRMAGAIPHYIPTVLDPRWELPVGPSVEAVERVLDAAPKARIVALTAPNYFGLLPPVRALVTAVHQRGKLLLIDAAHGAHLHTTPRLPEPIEAAAPDMVTHSLHKVSGALAQASVLHLYTADPTLQTQLFEVLNNFPVLSTSFSVPILASIEIALADLANQGQWEHALDLALDLRTQLDRIPGCQVVHFPVPSDTVYAQDPLRICIDVSHTGLSGYEIAHLLAEQPGHRQVVEMATGRQVLLIVTSAVTSEAMNRFVQALKDIIAQHGRPGRMLSPLSPPLDLPPMLMTPGQAWYANCRRRRLPVVEAARYGCVSGETVSTYPPGAPIVVQGEQLRPQDIAYLQQAQQSGATLHGAYDPQFETIQVLDI